MIPKRVITIDRNGRSACSEISVHDGAKYALADRIVRMAEDAAEYSRKSHRIALEADIEDRKAGRAEAKRGQICAVTIAIVGIVAASATGIWGNPYVAAVLGGGSLATLVGAFLVARRHTSEAERGEEDESTKEETSP
jgi:uncharacterized membrane protein